METFFEITSFVSKDALFIKEVISQLIKQGT